ncbi:MAG: cell wall-binding repeat-containing protein, partial [Caloramator sp.]|nr:cell wall-binding repeat-containing protein [Caloramator sp.]
MMTIRNNIKKVVIFLIFLFTISGYNRVFASTDINKELNVKITKYQTKDLFSTSLEISKKNYKKAQNIILITDENYMDLICALPLSKKINAPILIFNNKNLKPELINEIKRLGTKKIFLIGGQAKSIQQNLNGLKINIIQLSGKDRYETSYNIAKHINFKEAILVNGKNYIDAMSIAPVAAQRQIPIILVEKDSIPKQYKNLLKTLKKSNIYIVGDKDSISNKIDENFNKAIHIFGKDRYETNAKILRYFGKYIDSSRIFIYNPEIEGYNFQQLLIPSIYATQYNSYIIFNNNSTLGLSAKCIKELTKGNIELIYFDNNNISEDILKTYNFYLSNKISNKVSSELEKDKNNTLEKLILKEDLKIVNRDEILNQKIYYTNKALVLMYHHIDEENYSSITIKPERFEADLKMLKEKGFNIISLRYLLLAIDGQAKLPPNAVVITFDDGL